ncbi:glycosyl transferase family 2 [Lactonifactor longoviformis]|uniref:Rhamnosyltransferase n=1 Tax=Lactonifactor longoviformis DSM 17459 TaxID=1122155 RepID=A0A1M5AMB3_9CLOT|nr:glycosyltransferase family 2 protein [Lactonifactor longoviformis]POP32463.1 glycosyl transferase family 2 [Lactonifactor longoviformis]SHF31284.1 rhamnosyltransferase [Lactonifactor longoviformis DSM 17459]
MEERKKGRKTVDVVIPVYKAGDEFVKLLHGLAKQSYPIEKIVIMNTGKEYWKESWEREVPNMEVHHIEKSEFDHGGTRDEAVGYCCQEDIVLFMTQDAVPADTHLVENLTEAFENEKVKAAYARQLPNSDCRIIERYTRSFNYPKTSRIKSLEDLPELGIKTFFCSNVCAAYDRLAYEKLGGFPLHTIFNEDMIYAGHLIHKGYAIAYTAKARVYHSHNYGNIQQLKRNFDLAVSQVTHPEVFANIKSENEGIRLVKRTAAYLCAIHKPWLLPYLFLNSGFKFLGYRLGKAYRRLPKWLIRICTMNKEYWTFKM